MLFRRINNQNPIQSVSMINVNIVIISHKSDDIFRQCIKFHCLKINQEYIPAFSRSRFLVFRQYLPNTFLAQLFLQKGEVNFILNSVGKVNCCNSSVRHAVYMGIAVGCAIGYTGSRSKVAITI